MRGIYASDLRKGDRVVFCEYQRYYLGSRCPVPPILQQWIDTHDIEQRKAVFVGKKQDNSCKEWLCFLLDSPLTENFLEDPIINLLKQLAIDEKFWQSVLVIDTLLINSPVCIDRCASLDDLSIVACSMLDCQNIGFAKNFIRMCDASHCICWAHGSPETNEYKQAEEDLMKDLVTFDTNFTEWESRLFYYAVSKAAATYPSMYSLRHNSQVYCVVRRYDCTCNVNFQDLEQELHSKAHLKQQGNRSIKRASPPTPDVNQLVLDQNHFDSQSDQNAAKKARLDSSPPKKADTTVMDWLVTTPAKQSNIVHDIGNVPKSDYDVILESILDYSSLTSYTREKLARLIRTAEDNKSFTRGTIKAVLRELTRLKMVMLDEDEFNFLLVMKQSERESSQSQEQFDADDNDQSRQVIVVEDEPTYQPTPPSKTRFYGKKLAIFIERPEDPESGIKQLLVRSDMSYDDVLRLACVLMDCRQLRRDMMLVRQDSDGWNYKLEYELLIPARDDNSLWEKVYIGNLLQLRKITSAFLGGRYKLNFIATLEKYNRSITKKIDTLSEDYEGYLEIRGDGNCYYRAVIYGLLEQIICREDRLQCLLELHAIFAQIKFTEDEHIWQENHDKLLLALNKAAEGQCWMTLKELESDILNETIGLDRALIIAGKRLVRDYLHDNQDSDWNGLSLKIAVMSYERYNSFDEYLDNEVMKMGECAEGPHVDIGILPMLLNAYAEIVMLDRNETVDILKKGGLIDHANAENAAVTPRKFSVSLLFRPGHYDLLYPNGMLSKLFQGSFVLPEIQPHQEIEDDAMVEDEQQPVVKMQEDNEPWHEAPAVGTKRRVLPSTDVRSNNGDTGNPLQDIRRIADLITGNNAAPIAAEDKDKEKAFDKAWQGAYFKHTEMHLKWRSAAHQMHFELGIDLDTIFDCYAAEKPRHTDQWLEDCFQWKERKELLQQNAQSSSKRQQQPVSDHANISSHSKVSSSSSSSSNNNGYGSGVSYNPNTYVQQPKQQAPAPEIDYSGLDPDDAARLQQAVEDRQLSHFQVKEALPSIITLRKDGFCLQHMVNAIEEGILLEDTMRQYCLTQVTRSPPRNHIVATAEGSGGWIDADNKKKSKEVKQEKGQSSSSSAAGPLTVDMTAVDIANASPSFPLNSARAPLNTSNQHEYQVESQEWLQKVVKRKEEDLMLTQMLDKVPMSLRDGFKSSYQKVMKNLDCTLADIAVAVDANCFTEISLDNYIRKSKTVTPKAPQIVKTFGSHGSGAGSSNRFSSYIYQPVDSIARKKKETEDLPRSQIDHDDDQVQVHTQLQVSSSPSKDFNVEEYKQTLREDDLQQLQLGLERLELHYRKQAELNILRVLSGGFYPMELILEAVRKSNRCSESSINRYCSENVGMFFELKEEQEAKREKKRAELKQHQNPSSSSQSVFSRSDAIASGKQHASSSQQPHHRSEQKSAKDDDNISLTASTTSGDQVHDKASSAKQQISSTSPRKLCLSQKELAKMDIIFKDSFVYKLFVHAVTIFDLHPATVTEVIIELRCLNFRMIIREVLNRENKHGLAIEARQLYEANRTDDKVVVNLYRTAIDDENFDQQIMLNLIGMDDVKTMDQVRFKYQKWIVREKALSTTSSASSPAKCAREDFDGIDRNLIYNSSNVQAASGFAINQRPKSAMRDAFGASRDTDFFSSIASNGVGGVGGTSYWVPTPVSSQSSNRPRSATPSNSSLTKKGSGSGLSFMSPQSQLQLASPRSPGQINLSKNELFELKNIVFEGENAILRAEMIIWLNRLGYYDIGKAGQKELRPLLKQVRDSYLASVKKS